MGLTIRNIGALPPSSILSLFLFLFFFFYVLFFFFPLFSSFGSFPSLDLLPLQFALPFSFTPQLSLSVFSPLLPPPLDLLLIFFSLLRISPLPSPEFSLMFFFSFFLLLSLLPSVFLSPYFFLFLLFLSPDPPPSLPLFALAPPTSLFSPLTSSSSPGFFFGSPLTSPSSFLLLTFSFCFFSSFTFSFPFFPLLKKHFKKQRGALKTLQKQATKKIYLSY